MDLTAINITVPDLNTLMEEKRGDLVKMYNLVASYVKPCLVGAAVNFNIVDHLVKKPMTAEELAAVTNTNAPNMYRLLRGLAVIEILNAEENGKYSVTPFGMLLRADLPFGMKYGAKMMLSEQYIALGNISHSIETGEPSFAYCHGKPFYEFLQHNEEKEQIFAKCQFEATVVEVRQIVAAYDFSKFRKIVDVGGSNGAMIRTILLAHKNVAGVVFDTEDVINEASLFLKAEFGDRCIPIAGNFFESVPEDGDCYILKNILANWSDEKAVNILRNIRDQMKNDSTLLIIDGRPKDETKIMMDMIMMAVLGGKLRTDDEYRSLLSRAGMRLNRVVDIPDCACDVFEAVLQ